MRHDGSTSAYWGSDEGQWRLSPGLRPFPSPTHVRPQSAQLRRPRPRSATSALRRFATFSRKLALPFIAAAAAIGPFMRASSSVKKQFGKDREDGRRAPHRERRRHPHRRLPERVAVADRDVPAVRAGGVRFCIRWALALLAHRGESNLSRTLTKLRDTGIVEFEERGGRTRAPRLIARRVTLELDLVGSGSVVSVERPEALRFPVVPR